MSGSTATPGERSETDIVNVSDSPAPTEVSIVRAGFTPAPGVHRNVTASDSHSQNK